MKIVYVNDPSQTTIICPKYGFAKNFHATNYKNMNQRLKARRKCGEMFGFILEFRKHYRKKVKLPGE